MPGAREYSRKEHLFRNLACFLGKKRRLTRNRKTRTVGSVRKRDLKFYLLLITTAKNTGVGKNERKDTVIG